jgi:hypothetical protein
VTGVASGASDPKAVQHRQTGLLGFFRRHMISAGNVQLYSYVLCRAFVVLVYGLSMRTSRGTSLLARS